jgi:hypothetical protein
MNVYIQQKYRDTTIFGKHLSDFEVDSFEELPKIENSTGKIKINDLLNNRGGGRQQEDADKLV